MFWNLEKSSSDRHCDRFKMHLKVYLTTSAWRRTYKLILQIFMQIACDVQAICQANHHLLTITTEYDLEAKLSKFFKTHLGEPSVLLSGVISTLPRSVVALHAPSCVIIFIDKRLSISKMSGTNMNQLRKQTMAQVYIFNVVRNHNTQ